MIADLSAQLQSVVEHLRSEFGSLHTGRANVTMVESVKAPAYGTESPLKNLANISCPDSKTIRIEPWDKSIMGELENALRAANIGNPQNMGGYFLISVPPMTEERRKQVVKRSHEMLEQAKISVRNIRQDFLKKVRHQKDEKEISEDEAAREEKKIQEKVDETNRTIEEMGKKKESDLLSL